MVNCTICKKPIVLVPSATERAKRYGGKPADYAALFQQHAACIVAKREEETLTLIRRNYNQ